MEALAATRAQSSRQTSRDEDVTGLKAGSCVLKGQKDSKDRTRRCAGKEEPAASSSCCDRTQAWQSHT